MSGECPECDDYCYLNGMSCDLSKLEESGNGSLRINYDEEETLLSKLAIASEGAHFFDLVTGCLSLIHIATDQAPKEKKEEATAVAMILLGKSMEAFKRSIEKTRADYSQHPLPPSTLYPNQP